MRFDAAHGVILKRKAMATENSNPATPAESIGNADDMRNVTATDAEKARETAEEVAPEPDCENPAADEVSEEEAALDAEQAGLELDEETAEEAAAEVDKTDLGGKSKRELVEMFAEMLEKEPVQTLRKSVEAIKIAFYKLHRAETDAARRDFEAREEAGAEFVPAADESEARLKDLFREYRLRRDEYMAGLDKIKEENLKVKLQIIEELKELVDSDETLNNTFAKFRELQQRWKETGVVPQQKVKDLWETYNLHVENFYNFIKINKELRDLDLKKDYEQKASLCEQAEALVTEPSIVEAFHKLQKLHDEWRETGPVANEYKEALWERFKAASARINKQHQEFFERLKQEQVKNLELKSELCERTEALSEQPYTSRKEWNKAGERLLEIQKMWRTIGFAPKKDNTRIYERFRAACDKFFERKSRHFADVEGEHESNLRKKLALLDEMQAADVKEGGFDMIKDFQRRWSEIGFVPIKQKEAVQKRYKEAVDAMFGVLRGTERDRSMNRFKERLQTMKSSGDKRLRNERDRLYNKVRQMEQDIALLENNIGFFSKSKNAEAMVADIREKIEKAKRELRDTIEKVKMIDSRGAEEGAE